MSEQLQKSSTIVIILLGITVITRFLIATFEWDLSIMVYVMMGCILIAAFHGIRVVNRESNEEPNFIVNFKAGLSGSVRYSFFTGVFLFVYYSFLDPSYFNRTIDERKEILIEQRLEEGVSQTDIDAEVEQFMTFSEQIMAPFPWTTITLFSMIMASLLYCLILGLIAFKVPKLIR